MSGKIKVAIAGVGNCASSLVQGVCYYSNTKNSPIGLMHKKFGSYEVSDIEFVAAFDVDARKVNKDLSESIFQLPNCTKKFSDVPFLNVNVQKAPVMDGVAKHMESDFYSVDSDLADCNVSDVLKQSKAEILICYLPVGSSEAARFYAQECLKAGVGFINAIPEFICSDEGWIEKFRSKNLPCAGDDIKSQVGATIVHRILARLIYDRGQIIDSTYQLNVGGNADFYNMLDESRLTSKRISKTQAVTSILEDEEISVKIGPSDYIQHLNDNKVCYINIKGRQFGDIPFEMDVKLSVEDSPNSAGVIIDVIRAMKIALDRGMSGNLEAMSSYAFKSPYKQFRDDVACRKVEDFIKGN